MPVLTSWLKNADANSFFDAISATVAKTLKDYLHGNLTPMEAATRFVENFDIESSFNLDFQHHLQCLAAIAYDVSDSRGQTKIVKLLAALSNLRYGMEKGWHSKREMDLRGKTDATTVLAELHIAMSDEFNGLWGEVLSPIRGPYTVSLEDDEQWINFNAFIARLSAANVSCLGMREAGYLCDCFITDDDVREHAITFNLIVSAAAQHMIYSASKVFECCEQNSALVLGHLGWKKWLAGFKEAQTNPLIDTRGKKYAKLAVAAMTEVEQCWECLHTLRERQGVKHRGNISEEIKMKQASVRGFKRSHHEAFSDSLAVRT